MDLPKYKSKKAFRRPRQAHLHHTKNCLTEQCNCNDCFCRDVPMDQRDEDDEE